MVFFEDYVERLRELTATRPIVSRPEFDPENPRCVDELAHELLNRFHADNDETAFQLLVDATEPALTLAAQQLCLETGLAESVESVVDALYTSIYIDLPLTPPDERHFLARATTDMRSIALLRIRDLANSGHPADEDSPFMLFAANDEDVPEHERLMQDYQVTLSTAFHGLPIADRQLLLGRGAYDMSEAEVAELTDISLIDVNPKTDEAWERFRTAKDALLASDEPSGNGGTP